MSENQKPRRMDKNEQSSRPYPLLCYAVVAQACKDYRAALRWVKRHPDGKGYMRRHHDNVWVNPQWTIDECEDFFRNELDLWCDYDGEWIIREIRRMVDDE